MILSKHERRQNDIGSLICDNGLLRLRVVQEGHSLGLIIDARDAEMQWGSLYCAISGDDIRYTSAAGVQHAANLFAFDPVQQDGRTHGVMLHGHLGEATLSMTAQLVDESTWCRLRLTVNGIAEGPCRRLTQCWHLQSTGADPDAFWPMTPVLDDALVTNPAAFLQNGAHFAALVSDLMEGDPEVLGLQLRVDDDACIEYGIWDGGARAWNLSTPVRLSAALCLDARALQRRGFQQVVRLLGSHEDLTLVSQSDARPATMSLPQLPPVHDIDDWQPFRWEGSPAAIAAVVQHHLNAATAGDWQRLEDGLCWLDRLCLHQCTLGAPEESSLGVFGEGSEWELASLWLPLLLLQAYQLTGTPEYAYRGMAALKSLPLPQQSLVLGQTRPRFGDVLVQADFQEVFPLSGPEIIGAQFSADGLLLEVDDSKTSATPLRLVMDGTEDQYALVLNTVSIGVFPAEQLRAGIEIDVIRQRVL